MAIPTFNPPVAPSPGTRVTYQPKLLKAEFGDGYTQTTRDGMNHNRREVKLTWDVLTPAQADIIEAFFIERGGDGRFWYTISNTTTPIKWTCEQWERTHDMVHKIEATFTQQFDLGT